MALAEVLTRWRPGSFDRTWAEEFTDLGSPERIGEMLLRTWDNDGHPHDELALRMLRGQECEPVTLGWDGGLWNGRMWSGRVWAGHHRLWLYHTIGRTTIPTDVVAAGERRGWPACHCAPAQGWQTAPPQDHALA
jgi:hypothetical protein